MCGIAGLLSDRETGADAPEARIRAMVTALDHRGPDDSGHWIAPLPRGAVALGQARLSIVDLSPAGHQPMISADGRCVMVYNGEVYNAAELRADIEAALGPRAPAWRGHSDTEVILEAWALWGARATLDRLIGMFAIAVWDREARTLTLARDRFGIKPLYVRATDTTFLFGSEIKALLAAGGWRPAIDRGALAAYLRYNYVPGPHAILQGVEKLLPGHMLTRHADGRIERVVWWDFLQVVRDAQSEPLMLSDTEAEDRLDTLLRDAVGRRMIADVPLGAFLSGGIDSSSVVAAMQAQSSRPVRTFTLGFDEPGYDESAHAAAIARHLGTDHTELRVSPGDALDVIPRLATIYDEPFADSSQIPTYLVSALARREVTVALSGDGGDELFAGYERHAWAETLWRRVGSVPRPLARAGAAITRGLPPALWQGLGRIAGERRGAAKAAKLAEILSLQDGEALYRRLVSVFDAPSDIVPGATEPADFVGSGRVLGAVRGMMEQAQVLDALTYLPEDILAKVDRASMAVGLEVRVPLLDHRIAGFAMALPRDMRVRGGRQKWLLRRVLARYVPETLFERPKMGFGIPVDHWLRGPLRDWAEDLLSPQALEEGGYLRAEPIRQLWARHCRGGEDFTTHVWTILMFQAWRRRWGL